MSSPVITDTAVKGFVVALVSGILAVTFLPMGIAFAIIGFVGEPAAFKPLGLIFAAVGVVLALVAVVFRKRGREADEHEREARISRGTAEVLEAKLNPYSRVGTRNPMKLALLLAGSRDERTVYVPPTYAYEPGKHIEVAFAPDNPANFLPLE
jgi:membrane protein implicated in regulation of membrane protease activity